MTRGSILEYIRTVHSRYIRAKKNEKGKILDEFVIITGHHRKSAIRALGSKSHFKRADRRGRPRKYGPMVAAELKYLWEITDHLCSKRLHPFLAGLLNVLKRNGSHAISHEMETQIRALSPSTIDRLLNRWRSKAGHRSKVNISYRRIRVRLLIKPAYPLLLWLPPFFRMQV
jgi:hypothetical protein